MQIRLTFSKTGALIYIGNLDLYTLWERAARRARLPLTYSQGFHPQPKIHFAAPLPLGYASCCEVVDMRLNEDLEVAGVQERLNAALPEGIRVLGTRAIADGAPAVQTQVLSADYTVRMRGSGAHEDLEERVQLLLGAGSLLRERRGRTYDLRPLVEELEVRRGHEHEGILLEMRLRAQEGATGRPDEVLDALGVPRDLAQIERTALHFKPSADSAPRSAD